MNFQIPTSDANNTIGDHVVMLITLFRLYANATTLSVSYFIVLLSRPDLYLSDGSLMQLECTYYRQVSLAVKSLAKIGWLKQCSHIS